MGLCLCNPLYSLRKTADRMHRRGQTGAKRAAEVIKDRLAAIRLLDQTARCPDRPTKALA